MTAIRSVRAAEGRFVQIANAALQDQRLSFAARGILAYVLSLPPDQHLTAAWLETRATEGRRAVRSALRELETAGYYRKTRTSAGRGKWNWDQVMSDEAQPGQVTSDENRPHETTCGNVASSQVSSSDRFTPDENRSDKNSKTVDLPKTKKDVSLSEMLAAAVPSATEREIEDSITTIQTRHAQGLIQSERAWLRTLIANGDATSFVSDTKSSSERKTSNPAYDNAIAAGQRVQAAMDGLFTSPCQESAPDRAFADAQRSKVERAKVSAMCRIDDHDHCQQDWCKCPCSHRAKYRYPTSPYAA